MDASPITRVTGGVAADGSALLLNFEANGSVSEYVLHKSDAGGLVHLLLALLSLASDEGESRVGPLPVDAVSIGETGTGEALLGFEISGVKLAFGLPRARLQWLARALLALSAEAELPS